MTGTTSWVRNGGSIPALYIRCGCLESNKPEGAMLKLEDSPSKARHSPMLRKRSLALRIVARSNGRWSVSGYSSQR